MQLNLLFTENGVIIYSYVMVGFLALGTFSWLKLSDLVRMSIVFPLLIMLANS